MRLLIKNIKHLVGIDTKCRRRFVGAEMDSIEQIDEGYLIANSGVIIEYGKMSSLSSESADQVIDATGSTVLPAFCDSHSHVIYAGSREREFEERLCGASYEQIAQHGGGILNSAKLLHEATEEELVGAALPRIGRMMASGTASIEIKSGYGLSVEDELKMLRAARRIKELVPATIKTTLLGAHAIPEQYRDVPQQYVDLVCREMIPIAAHEGLAQFVDVFCERGFFDLSQTEQIIDCGLRYGLMPKIHADQLTNLGGTQLAVSKRALSVDHLESADERQIEALRGSVTMPTLLPGSSFFLNKPYAPARKMIDSGLGVALATDFNPGSTPNGDMKFILSLATIKMRMTVNEAFNAATVNGAYAMGLADRGRIAPGLRCDLIITKPIPSLAYMPYWYGEDLTKQLIINGKTADYEQFRIS